MYQLYDWFAGLSTNGPVVLYDEQFNSLVVAPMDNFKSAVHYTNRHTNSTQATAAHVWETGVSSELEVLPVGFEHRTMLVAGVGITATLDTWGKAFRAAYVQKHIVTSPPSFHFGTQKVEICFPPCFARSTVRCWIKNTSWIQ